VLISADPELRELHALVPRLNHESAAGPLFGELEVGMQERPGAIVVFVANDNTLSHLLGALAALERCGREAAADAWW
jgi:hypothetical protein